MLFTDLSDPVYHGKLDKLAAEYHDELKKFEEHLNQTLYGA